MEKPTIEEALAYFRQLDPQWTVLMEFLEQQREGRFSDIRRNMQTPDCQPHQYYVLTGEMMGIDEVLSILKG